MKRLIPIFALVLSACATTSTRDVINCNNAAKVRAAATLALQALDRVCPIY